MNESAKRITGEALLLPREDRAQLIDALLNSLNPPAQNEIERQWADEAEKRVRDYDEGKIEALDGERVFAEIRERLKR